MTEDIKNISTSSSSRSSSSSLSISKGVDGSRQEKRRKDSNTWAQSVTLLNIPPTLPHFLHPFLLLGCFAYFPLLSFGLFLVHPFVSSPPASICTPPFIIVCLLYFHCVRFQVFFSSTHFFLVLFVTVQFCLILSIISSTTTQTVSAFCTWPFNIQTHYYTLICEHRPPPRLQKHTFLPKTEQMAELAASDLHLAVRLRNIELLPSFSVMDHLKCCCTCSTAVQLVIYLDFCSFCQSLSEF